MCLLAGLSHTSVPCLATAVALRSRQLHQLKERWNRLQKGLVFEKHLRLSFVVCVPHGVCGGQKTTCRSHVVYSILGPTYQPQTARLASKCLHHTSHHITHVQTVFKEYAVGINFTLILLYDTLSILI